jgi:hypothetical protein
MSLRLHVDAAGRLSVGKGRRTVAVVDMQTMSATKA